MDVSAIRNRIFGYTEHETAEQTSLISWTIPFYLPKSSAGAADSDRHQQSSPSLPNISEWVSKKACPKILFQIVL